MPKNVTVSVSDDLSSKMEELREVNWSQVARSAFTQYVIQRKSPDLAELLETLKTQKGAEFVKGRVFADKLVKKIGYSGFDIIMQEYFTRHQDERERGYHGPTGPFDRVLSSSEIMHDILAKKKHLSESSQSFLDGLIERMREIHRALK